MKPGHIHLAIPPQQIPPSFARAVSPGCPTDGVTISQDFLPPWVTDDKAPRTTTSILRSTSWNSVETHPQAATTAIWRVEPGSFVTFALDTAAVAAKFPEGSEAYKEILSMPVGRYVGFVSSSYGYQDDADEFVEELIVNYVGSAMPPLEELSTHWVPVSPSSKLDWSPGISPLQTTRMFPWKDRLLWTTLGTRLDMTHFHGSLLRFALSDDEFAKFEDKASVDYGSGVTSLIDVDDPMYKLRIPQFKIPAQIWQDIRGVDISEDPTLFTAEVENLERLVRYHTRTDNDTDDEGYVAEDEESMDGGGSSLLDTTSESDDGNLASAYSLDEDEFMEGDQTIRVDDGSLGRALD